MRYTLVCGLEVHVELNTKSKMFCGCANDWFGAEPNTHTCPVCLGLPGALPVPNKKAIESCIKIGLALNCHIPLLSKFDRKNYFYPDLAKGYQISQYDQPFTQNGYVLLSGNKRIGITRAHMEEDTGNLKHALVEGEKVSLIDFNRSGSPLVEIVTEADFENASQVKEYLQKLQQIVRYLGVADADMEKGGMRLEPNISLRKEGEKGLPNYKVEVKNINSFNFVEKAIAYEMQRQAELLDQGIRPTQETRGWDEDKKMTISQRSKEEAAEYRYFPEPDIPPFIWTQKFVDTLKEQLPELPDEKLARFIKQYGLSEYNAAILTRTPKSADFFEETVRESSKKSIDPSKVANTIINKKVDISSTTPAQVVVMISESEVQNTITPEALQKTLQHVLDENPHVVGEIKNGKVQAVMYLVGQAMKQLKGQAKADTVKSELEKLIKG